MCKDASGQVVNVALVAETSLINLLTVSGLINTDEGKAITGDFAVLVGDLKNWKSGTPATDILEVVQDLEAAVPALPIPPPYNVLVPVILAGLATILTLLGANSPAPVPAGVEATTEALAAHQELHAHSLAAVGRAKVTQLTGYKPSMFTEARAMLGDTHVAADAYTETWNKTVAEHGLPDTLKAA